MSNQVTRCLIISNLEFKVLAALYDISSVWIFQDTDNAEDADILAAAGELAAKGLITVDSSTRVTDQYLAGIFDIISQAAYMFKMIIPQDRTKICCCYISANKAALVEKCATRIGYIRISLQELLGWTELLTASPLVLGELADKEDTGTAGWVKLSNANENEYWYLDLAYDSSLIADDNVLLIIDCYDTRAGIISGRLLLVRQQLDIVLLAAGADKKRISNYSSQQLVNWLQNPENKTASGGRNHDIS